MVISEGRDCRVGCGTICGTWEVEDGPKDFFLRNVMAELTFTEMVEVSEELFGGRAGGGAFSSRCYSVAGAHDNLSKEPEAGISVLVSHARETSQLRTQMRALEVLKITDQANDRTCMGLEERSQH